MQKGKEFILCSANWYKDLELKNPELLLVRGNAPYNMDRGIVFSGWRHNCCLYQMCAITGLRQAEAGEEIQGFLTSKNRFVDRHEAARIAYDAGQVNDRIYWGEDIDWSIRLLHSEDIY